jgi:CHASE1-domain containing sensor protein
MLGGPVSCIVSAGWGVSTLWLFGVLSISELPANWATWWISDTLGVMLVIPLFWMLFSQRQDIWKQRRLHVGLPLLLLLSIAIGIFIVSSQQEEDRVRSEFNEYSSLIAESVEKELIKNIEVLYSLQSFLNATGEISREHFKNYVQRTLERNSSIQALSWNPVITAEERSDDGELISARERKKYVVVQYIEPMEKNKKAFGFDVYSNEARRAGLDQSQRTRELVATDPIILVQERGTQKGVLFFLPVFKSQVSEFISRTNLTITT